MMMSMATKHYDIGTVFDGEQSRKVVFVDANPPFDEERPRRRAGKLTTRAPVRVSRSENSPN